MTDLRRYPLRISIPRTETARSTLRFRHTAYLVEIDDCGKKYTRWRRFTNFIWLHGELLRRAQDGKLQRSEIPELPQKRVVGNMDPAFIERRRATLEEYLQKLARLPLVVKDDAVWAFLDAELVTAAVPRFLCRRTTSQKEVEDCLGTLRKVVAKQDNVFRFCNEVVMQELVAFAEAEAAEPEAPLAGPAYARNTHQLQQAMHLKLANRIQFCKILHELIKNESGIRTMVDHGMFGALVKMLARSVDENETADDALCEQYRIVCRLSKENLLALLEGSHGAALLNFCQEDGLSTLKRIAEGNVALHPICASLLWNALQNAGVVDVLVGITGDNSSSRPVLLLFGSLLKSEDLRARVLTSLCIARIVRHEGALGAEEVPYLLEAISDVAAEFDAAEKRAVEQTAKNNLDMSELSFSVSMTSRSSVQPRGSQFQNVNDSSDRGLAGAAESRSSLSSILAPMLPIERDALLVKQTKEICCAKDLPRLIPLLQLGDAGDIDEVVCLAVVILDNFVQIELAEERASFSDLQILIEPLQRIIEAEEEDDGSQAHERCEQIRMRAARILIRLELPNKDAAGEPPNIHTFVRRAKILEVLDRHSTMCQDKSKRHIEEANHQRHSHDQVIDTCGLTQELCISDARLAEFARELTVLEAKRRTLEQEERNSSQAIEEMQLCIERTGVKKACLKSEIDVISESIFEQAQLLAESNCEEVLAHCERSLEEISAQVAEKAAEKKAVEADIREKEERQREVEANFQECQRREAELAEVRDTAPAHLERVQASLQETQCRIQEMQEKSFDLEFAMRQGELELTRIQGTSAEAEAALQKTRQMTSKLEAFQKELNSEIVLTDSEIERLRNFDMELQPARPARLRKSSEANADGAEGETEEGAPSWEDMQAEQDFRSTLHFRSFSKLVAERREHWEAERRWLEERLAKTQGVVADIKKSKVAADQQLIQLKDEEARLQKEETLISDFDGHIHRHLEAEMAASEARDRLMHIKTELVEANNALVTITSLFEDAQSEKFQADVDLNRAREIERAEMAKMLQARVEIESHTTKLECRTRDFLQELRDVELGEYRLTFLQKRVGDQLGEEARGRMHLREEVRRLIAELQRLDEQLDVVSDYHHDIEFNACAG